MTPILELHGLYKRFEPGPWVIEDFHLHVEPGCLVCVLGPSGCGKTTLLRLICGFEAPDRGEIRKEGEVISRPGRMLAPERRRIGMVFQDYALFPHLTVEDNVLFGLRRYPRWPLSWLDGLLGRVQRAAPGAGERGPEAHAPGHADVFRLTGLAGLERRFPHELSGGQQQRVALARALAHRPHLVLLDEPFSNLDTGLRQRIRGEVRTVLRRTGTTSVLVTHDQEEAINLADRIAVMNRGRLEQWGSPQEVLYRPVNRFVAGFVGLSQFLPGRVVGHAVETELGAHALPEGRHLPSGTPVEVLLRPNYVQAVDPGLGVETRVAALEYQGVELLYTLALPSGATFQATLPGHLALNPGDAAWVRFHPPELVCFPTHGG